MKFIKAVIQVGDRVERSTLLFLTIVSGIGCRYGTRLRPFGLHQA